MDEQQRRQQRNERLLASAVKFLIDGGEEKAATILLSCTLTSEKVIVLSRWEEDYTKTVITLVAPRVGYDFLTPLNDSANYESPEALAELPEKFHICASIRTAFNALLGTGVELSVKANLVPITEQWRDEVLALLRRDSVNNQGLQFSPKAPMVTWKNLRFRSQTEIRIAEALERAHVLFLPDCVARLGFSQWQNREADFLVCHKGKWGTIEVDSPSSHPPTRTVEDHERDRLFKVHGIRVVERFDASECWQNADGVVKRFLYLLGQ
jgi:hypothetical protein